ncbi:hypothetical protein H5410_002603 [Solanum commersonii]|uniref:Uncharacterized protein n=1 Tax=Solanum commersonii TaxID=4109 RepID=A0A9J6B2E1_SOLCO|nr:hypothetical protein H5410_002603 [Solanum commersonii]
MAFPRSQNSLEESQFIEKVTTLWKSHNSSKKSQPKLRILQENGNRRHSQRQHGDLIFAHATPMGEGTITKLKKRLLFLGNHTLREANINADELSKHIHMHTTPQA